MSVCKCLLIPTNTKASQPKKNLNQDETLVEKHDKIRIKQKIMIQFSESMNLTEEFSKQQLTKIILYTQTMQLHQMKYS